MRRAPQILIVLTISSLILTSSRAFVPEYDFSFSTGKDTKYLIAGELNFYGKLIGKEIQTGTLPIDFITWINISNPDLSSTIDYLADSTLSTISVLSSNMIIPDVNTMYVLNITSREIERFDDANLNLNDLPILVLGVEEYASFEETLDYGMISFGEIEISNEKTTAMFVISDDKLHIGMKNSPSFIIVPLSLIEETKGGYSFISDNNGSKLWEDSAGNWIIIAKDSPLNLVSFSSLSVVLFDKPESFGLEVRRSTKLPNAEYMLYNLSTSLSSIDQNSMMELPDFLLRFASPSVDIMNGACLVFNSNDTINVDGKEKNFSKVGLLRFERATFSINKHEETISLSGDGKSTLIFLGDTVYNDIPVSYIGGLALPLHSIALWLLAIAIFIIFSIVLRRKGEEKVFGIFPLEIGQKDKKIIKRISLVLHIVFAILTIILFDSAFSSIFGLSFIPYLSRNIIISITILSIEIVFIATCFIMFGLPTRIGVNTLMNFIGLGKEGKNVGKSLALVVMWIFSLSYLTFLSNALVGLVKDIMMGMAP